MIELRWLKGDWEFGKFKLQVRYRKFYVDDGGSFRFTEEWQEWQDVYSEKYIAKEKGLEEKFKHYCRNLSSCDSFTGDYYYTLAKIAEEHFKEKKC